ncbi:O-Antigen ligase [Lutibacter agarilyticus]|uniref:O-Antigen ligase n=1 Tax=Lutibacter agarilyticus TaxID=1109740 RepID=A0A238WU16_9FLAO|nr:O-antigen ligase family protein [Lutibacter agarilyticus]SNR49918.1 O-Antigen ligase [Lutibacter agarilyticus]
MFKTIIIFVLVLIGIIRYLLKRQKKEDSKYILLSTFIQIIPFAFGKSLFTFFSGYEIGGGHNLVIGAFYNSIKIGTEFIFVIIFILFGFSKFSKKAFVFKENIWFYVFIILCGISYFNPVNFVPLSFTPLFFFIIQFVFLLKLIEINLSRKDILRGIYDGLAMYSLLNLLLTICYPILGIETAVTVFSGNSGLSWSLRRGVKSAVGVFGHPGTFSLSCLLTLIFFYASFLNDYKKTKSKMFLAINIFIIALTFSRTTYMGAVLVMLLLTIISKKKEGIFSIKNIIIFLILFFVSIFVLYLTPLSEMFLGVEALGQVQNRLVHYFIGYEIWRGSPIIGVGINEHIYYMQQVFNVNLLPNTGSESSAFYLRSPIHNIHIIVLAETGLIGISCWFIYFISKINFYSKNTNTKYFDDNILSLSFTGMLIAIFVYGFTGWSPFNFQVFPIIILIGYFARVFLKETKLEEIKSIS